MNYLKSISSKKLLTTLILISAFAISCGNIGSKKADNSDSEVIINNDEVQLNKRNNTTNDSVTVEIMPSFQAKSTQNSNDFRYKLFKIAEVFPPIVKGETVQATMANIDLRNARISTSYNKQGSSYAGALDLMEIVRNPEGNLSFRIRSGAEFTNSDVNAVYSENGKIWTALATSNPKLVSGSDRAALRMFEIQNNQLQIDRGNSASLSGFAAVSIQKFNENIIATSGNNAGLTILNEDISEKKEFIPLENARWVDKNEDYVVVLSGDKNNDEFGEVVVLDANNLEEESRFRFKGASVEGGKSTIQLVGNLAMIAAGKEGVKVMDMNTGEIVDEIEIPSNNSGVTFATNAVAADRDLMFISNGGGGVYVAEANMNFNEYSAGNDLGLQLVGKLDFGDIASTNHIDYVGNLLVVATGEGGTKIVILKERDHEEDDDEDEDDDD